MSHCTMFGLAILLSIHLLGGPSLAADRIIFYSDRDVNQGIHNELYVIDADGENLVRLTRNFAAPYPDPDGVTEILLRERDGKSRTVELPFQMLGSVPIWSPDGSKIAFASDRHGDQNIYVAAGDWTGLTRLTREPTRDWHPVWAPDGDLIAFAGELSGKREIHTIRLEDGGVEKLTDSPEGGNGHPLWSADGMQVLFRSDRLGNEEVFIMAADGSKQRPVTNNKRVRYNAGWPHWLPEDSPTVAMLQTPEEQFRSGVLLTDEQVPDWPAKFVISFENGRDRSVDVFWLPSALSEIHQTLLEPGASAAFWTFQGHRFRFRDHESGFVIREDAIADSTEDKVLVE